MKNKIELNEIGNEINNLTNRIKDADKIVSDYKRRLMYLENDCYMFPVCSGAKKQLETKELEHWLEERHEEIDCAKKRIGTDGVAFLLKLQGQKRELQAKYKTILAAENERIAVDAVKLFGYSVIKQEAK